MILTVVTARTTYIAICMNQLVFLLQTHGLPIFLSNAKITPNWTNGAFVGDLGLN